LIDVTSGGDRTILFSTHIVADLERIASRVWILKDGQLLVDEQLDSLKEAAVRMALSRSGQMPANADIEAGMSLEEIFLELHR
jgi:ABC-2 type transport system ATP-binding protein